MTEPTPAPEEAAAPNLPPVEAPAEDTPAAPAASNEAPAATPPAPSKQANKPGFYQTNVKKVREFDFRMTGKRAAGMACGPANRILAHHVVTAQDHPAAAPLIVDEVATVIVAKLLEKGVALKLDNQMEMSVRSMITPGEGSKIAKATATAAAAPAPDTASQAKYDALIATLEKDPTLNTDPEKKNALEALQNAQKTSKPLKLEELTKVVEICSVVNLIDKVQAQKLVSRMQELGAITAEQNGEIMKEVEKKMVDGKVPVDIIRIMVEEKGKKK